MSACQILIVFLVTKFSDYLYIHNRINVFFNSQLNFLYTLFEFFCLVHTLLYLSLRENLLFLNLNICVLTALAYHKGLARRKI